MDFPEVLEKIGLSEKQAKVYLALLELGTAAVQSIALKAEIKRPTTYLILDELQARGLVSIIPRAKKALYTAESPEYLASSINKQQELLKRFLPDLLVLHNAKKEKPQVQLFSGPEGIRQIYQQIYDSKEVWFFGTVREVNKIYPEGLAQFLKRTREQSLQVRDLLTRSPEDLNYARKVIGGTGYQIRFIPDEFRFPTDSALFGERVAFFSFRPQIFVVVIKSQEISQSLKILYELAWQNAKGLREV